MRRIALCLTLTLCVTGCTRIPRGSEAHVAGLVKERIGEEVCLVWNKSCFRDSRIDGYIQELISRPIIGESAVQIALLNNPEVQATFEEIGIAQADFIEAGLLTNPAFDIDVRYPPEKRLKTNIEYLVTAVFLDIFLIPLRTRVAAVELEQTKLRVANEILDLSFEVRKTYYELIAELRMLPYAEEIAELASIQTEIAQRQHDVGNIYRLDLAEHEADSLTAALYVIRTQDEIVRLKEKLNRLLGFCGEVCLSFPEEMPEESIEDRFDLCELESVAFQERIDLQVARFEILRLSRMLGLKEWWTYTNLSLGLAGERETDGSNLLGPSFSGDIPIFNSGQAARMRLFSKLRQAQDRLASLEIRILSEVREAHQLLMNHLNMMKQYRTGVIPMQHNIAASSEELYNVMGLGIDRLLENKRRETEAYRDWIASVKNYWVSRVQLDRALGGNLHRLLPVEGGSP